MGSDQLLLQFKVSADWLIRNSHLFLSGSHPNSLSPAAHVHEPGLGRQYLDRWREKLKLLGDRTCRTQLVQRIMSADELTHHHVVKTTQRAALADHRLAIALGSFVPQQAHGLVEPRMLLVE